jgi:hypothetical protein
MNLILLVSRISNSFIRCCASFSFSAAFLFYSCSWNCFLSAAICSFFCASSILWCFFSASTARFSSSVALCATTYCSASAFCFLSISSFSFLTACAANFLSSSSYLLTSFSCYLIIFCSFLALIKFIFISRSII